MRNQEEELKQLRKIFDRTARQNAALFRVITDKDIEIEDIKDFNRQLKQALAFTFICYLLLAYMGYKESYQCNDTIVDCFAKYSKCMIRQHEENNRH